MITQIERVTITERAHSMLFVRHCEQNNFDSKDCPIYRDIYTGIDGIDRDIRDRQGKTGYTGIDREKPVIQG